MNPRRIMRIILNQEKIPYKGRRYEGSYMEQWVGSTTYPAVGLRQLELATCITKANDRSGWYIGSDSFTGCSLILDYDDRDGDGDNEKH